MAVLTPSRAQAIYDIYQLDPETGAPGVRVGQASSRGVALQKILVWRETYLSDDPPEVLPRYAVLARDADWAQATVH